MGIPSSPGGEWLAAGAGPGLVVIDELTNLFGPVHFDHTIHATMSRLEDGCASCHHQQEPGVASVLSCRTCHPTSSGTSTFDVPGLKAAYHRHCLACHRDWSGENACGSCHEERGAGAPAVPHDPTDIVGTRHPSLEGNPTFVYETPEAVGGAVGPLVTFHHVDHIERFGVNCADCHRESSCGSCHGTSSLLPRPAIDRHDRCFSCHSEQPCSRCHDQATRPRFEHELRSGWSLGSYHESLACADCHGSTREFTVPVGRSCGACHARANPASFDHAATGVPLAGSHAHFDCARCHDERRPDAAPTCSACHPDRSYPRQWPGLATPPAAAGCAAQIRRAAATADPGGPARITAPGAPAAEDYSAPPATSILRGR